MPSPTTKRTAKAKEQHPPPQLSCKLCREKKLKCDKQAPCGNCKTSGAECNAVFRHRLPRGRHAKHSSRDTFQSTTRPTSPSHNSNSELGTHKKEHKRLERRLESLVPEQVLSESDHCIPIDKHRPDVKGSFSRQSDPPQGNLKKQVVPDKHVWSDTVGNIPKLVQNTSFGLGFEKFSEEGSSSDLSGNDCGFGGLSLWNSDPKILRPHSADGGPLRSKVRETRLCEVYLHQVDPIIKILHRPTVDRWLRRGHPYLHYPHGHVSTEALAWAVCYSAVCSMTEEQCQTLIQQSKPAAVAAYQQGCENSLDRAGYLTTDDIVVLQAFVLYLIGRGSQDKSLAVWTLTAILVRIATAQEIHAETQERESTFDQQMRLRLWLTICSIDLQASMAQGTRPMITVDEVRPALSRMRIVNDEDLSNKGADNDTIQDREDLTDVTLAMIWYHLQVTGRLLHDLVPGCHDRTQLDSIASGVIDHAWREQQAREFQRKALGLISFCDTESSPYAWFTWHRAQCLVSSVRISATRPTSSVFSSNSTFLSRSKRGSDLFERTIAVLKKSLQMQSDPRAEGFRWHVNVPWTEIAIATSECLACHDPSIVCRVWPTIEAAFQLYKSRATQSKTYGILARRMQQMEQMWARTATMPTLRQDSCQYEDTSSLHTVRQPALPRTPIFTPSTVATEISSDVSWTVATTPSSTDWTSLYSLPDDTLQPIAPTNTEMERLTEATITWVGKESLAENGSQQAIRDMDLWCNSSFNASSFDAMIIAGAET